MTDKTERRISDAEALDKIAALHLDEMSYENPSSALENLSRSPLMARGQDKTHCPLGHGYTPENTRILGMGIRPRTRASRRKGRGHAGPASELGTERRPVQASTTHRPRASPAGRCSVRAISPSTEAVGHD